MAPLIERYNPVKLIFVGGAERLRDLVILADCNIGRIESHPAVFSK